MARGGKREGAGRPPIDRTPDGKIYEDAESYLEAVVRGTVAADPARIAAARVLISYQKSKIRGPKKSPGPAELAKKDRLTLENAMAEEFERKAAEIRLKHKAKLK